MSIIEKTIDKLNSKIKDVFGKDQSDEFNPFVYFSAGESLIDKDRDFNIDSKQIQSFFKPIDNLFGDYEVRKKFNFHNILYSRRFFNLPQDNPNRVWTKNDLINLIPNNNARKPFELFLKKGENIIQEFTLDDSILLFLIIYDKNEFNIYIECFMTSSNELIDENKKTLFKVIDEKIGNNANILQIFALDPQKLIQCIDLDNARQEHFILEISRNEKGIKVQEIRNFVTNILNGDRKIYFEISRTEFFKNNNLADNKSNRKLLMLFQNRKYKLKSFESHKSFRARIGYEDNHYVLFLHPYESESNGPIRFPPQA